jgi:hypothetical protein
LAKHKKSVKIAGKGNFGRLGNESIKWTPSLCTFGSDRGDNGEDVGDLYRLMYVIFQQKIRDRQFAGRWYIKGDGIREGKAAKPRTDFLSCIKTNVNSIG